MKVDKRTLAKLEARRAARLRGRDYSPLEAIEPTRSAQLLQVCWSVVFALSLGLEGISLALLLMQGEMLLALWPLVIMAITTLIFIIATRLSIAPLMTWHYARENAESLRQIREELRVLAAQGAAAPKPAPHPIPKTTNTPLTQPPTPPNDDVTVSCPACGAKVAVRRENLGKHVSCPLCGQRFILD